MIGIRMVTPKTTDGPALDVADIISISKLPPMKISDQVCGNSYIVLHKVPESVHVDLTALNYYRDNKLPICNLDRDPVTKREFPKLRCPFGQRDFQRDALGQHPAKECPSRHSRTSSKGARNSGMRL